MWRRRGLLRAALGSALVGLVALAPAAPAPALVTPAAAPTLHVRTVAAAGTSVAYAELGTGRPILLLNGTASPMNEWDPSLLRGLAAHARVIVLDYPGLGRSGPAPGAWTFEAAAGWVAAFIEQVAPGTPVDVLGWSMGGFIAQRLAIGHPQLVRRLVLAATNLGGSRAVLGPGWVRRADSQPDESDATYLATNYPRTGTAQAAGRAFLARLEAAVDSGAYPVEAVPARTQRAMVAAEDPWLRDDTTAQLLRGVSAPVLVATGAQDIITPPVNSRRIAALLPDATLWLMPGSGHSFLFQDPELTARRVSAFLAAR